MVSKYNAQYIISQNQPVSRARLPINRLGIIFGDNEMKIYEITIERGQDILEVFCAIDGLDDIFDEAENAYLNGK